jgi:hypothetical protein
MKALLITSLAMVCLTIGWVRAQNPAPVVIQAASPAAAAAPVAPSAQAATDSKTILQLLQQMQATNAATIKKQEATLAALDELQKAANDLKIFSKRG